MSAPTRSGFTLIELIIVIAILSVLVGVAVPYYQDSIVDARRSQLKQNLAGYRKTMGEFRADQRRGPFRVQVINGATVMVADPQANIGSGSELVCGPVQIVNGGVTRRTNIKYLPALPTLNDPVTGEQIMKDAAGTSKWSYVAGLCKFRDANTDTIFDISSEFAFEDVDNNDLYNQASGDVVLYNTVVAGPFVPLDYTDISVTTSEGPY